MRLWTIQAAAAWQMAERRGRLQADGRRVWSDFRPAYRWMMDQMAVRIQHPRAVYPIWSWPVRPDLRHVGHAPSGSANVLLEFEMAEDRVLLSDFDGWHLVLNGIEPESWEDIFHLDQVETVQATVSWIELDQIISVRPFTAR